MRNVNSHSLIIKIIVFLFINLLFLFAPNKADAAPQISGASDNRAFYPDSQIPKYEKLEITFQVNTVAANLQFPYDPTPPPGIPAGAGISVDAQFTPDNWQTFYSQPAFYYQDYQYQDVNGKDWIYPTGSYSWKVRFAPDRVGDWQYKLIAKDAGGQTVSNPVSFAVSSSANKGFIGVSPTDSRYFEYGDGTYFPSLGYNMNYNHVSWDEPVQGNENNFRIMGQNGIQLARMWLSQWGIFGSMFGHWRSMSLGSEYDGLTFEQAYPGSEVSMKLYWTDGQPVGNPAMFIGWMKKAPAVKRNTKYHISIRYLLPESLAGPRVAGRPYGLTAKVGLWIDNIWESGTGTVVAPYAKEASGWTNLEGEYNSGSLDFLPNFYLVLENVIDGTASGFGNTAYIDYVEIKEDLGNGQYGPNIVPKSWMAQHYYFNQHESLAFDKVVDLAKQYGIYLRPVILEKNDWIFNKIGYDGSLNVSYSNNNFYGNWRTVTKVRWLHQSWWRYLQARWGYSPNIHSWELLNEGDPYSGLHYTQADEFGKYMHCEVFGMPVDDTNGWKCNYAHPNRHMTNTSHWNSFPTLPFWENNNYPNIDFADFHQYTNEGATTNLRVDAEGTYSVNIGLPSDFYDTASSTNKASLAVGAKQTFGVGKPTVRGETGFTIGDSDGWNHGYFATDTQGIWLHKFIWGQINPGGLIESYWYDTQHIYPSGIDLRPLFGRYYKFIKDIPLSNGNYVNAEAIASDANIRAWGQKDIANGRVHLWIDNKNHTWKNVVDGTVINPASATITVSGFRPNTAYPVQWWDTYAGSLLQNEVINSNNSGDIIIYVSNLTADTAVKIGDYSVTPSPSPPPACPGDLNGDNIINLADLAVVLSAWGQSSKVGDTNADGIVNLADIANILSKWGNCL